MVEWASLGIEMVAGVIIVLAVARATWGYATRWLGQASETDREWVRLRFGKQLVLALEFQVAADLLTVAIHPTLAALLVAGGVVAIRTVLNFFLDHEVRRLEARLARAESSAAGGGAPRGPRSQRPPVA